YPGFGGQAGGDGVLQPRVNRGVGHFAAVEQVDDDEVERACQTRHDVQGVAFHELDAGIGTIDAELFAELVQRRLPINADDGDVGPDATQNVESGSHGHAQHQDATRPGAGLPNVAYDLAPESVHVVAVLEGAVGRVQRVGAKPARQVHGAVMLGRDRGFWLVEPGHGASVAHRAAGRQG